MSHDTMTVDRPRSVDPPESDVGDLRARIDDIDQQLARLIAARTELARSLGRSKQRAGAPLQDPAREAEVVRQAAIRARREALDEEVVRQIYWCLIDLSRKVQREDRS